MSSKNTLAKDIALLKCIYNEFDIKDDNTIIDIFCMIKQLDDKLPPRKIKELLPSAFNFDFYERNLSYIFKYDDTNYFGVIRRKYQKSGIISLFHHQEDFLNAFLKRYPSPQDVNLPFWNWNLQILQHYLKIIYKKGFSEYVLKKVLMSVPTHTTNPFLSSSRNLINSNEYHLFVWYICFIKTEKKLNHYIPIRFDCENLETNYNSLKLYETNTELNTKRNKSNNNNIFLLLRRCLPKTDSPENCVFLINKSIFKEKYFEQEFLRLDNDFFLESKFVFITINDIKNLYKQNSCTYLHEFYKSFKQFKKNIVEYIKFDATIDNNPLQKIREIIKKYFNN